MDLPDLKKLDKMIALCRKRGVSTIKIDNIELTLGEPPVAKTKKTPKTLPESSPTSLGVEGVESDSLSNEELLFWSTGLLPADDAAKQ